MNKIFLKIAFIFIILICFSYAQNSVITIHGTGDPNTSAHLFITAQGENKAYLKADIIIVEAGASLVAWHPDALSEAEISGEGEIVFLELTIEDILLFFDTAVEEGTLVGKGPGKSAQGRLKALKNMLIVTKNLIAEGDIEGARDQLYDAYRKTDGESKPPDFVQGPAAPKLAILIKGLRSGLVYEMTTDNTIAASNEARNMTESNGTKNMTESNAELEHNLKTDKDYLVIPDKFKLERNHPNPFNPTTTIRFAIPQEDYVVIAIYNFAGQKVATLANQRFNAGFHEVKWDASDVATGIYFYNIKAGQFQDLKKMILMK